MRIKSFFMNPSLSTIKSGGVVLAITIATVGCGNTQPDSSENEIGVKAAALSPPSRLEVPELPEQVEVIVVEAEEEALPVESSEGIIPAYFVRVRPGENLIDLSQWAQTTPTELAALNGMEVQDTLYAGQKLGITLSTDEEMDAFEDQREMAQQDRLDSYLADRGGLETVESHAVRQGESDWGVAQANGGYPMWVMQAFNDGMDLSRLAIGDTITLPVTMDRVEATADFEEGSDADALGVEESEGCSL